MMVHFRKHISFEMIGEVNEALVSCLQGDETPLSDEERRAFMASASVTKPAADESTTTKRADKKVI